MSFGQRLREVREGFERPFWVANISEIFERLSYYGAYASLAIFLHERLLFSTERTASIAGIFGFVWIVAAFGGPIADRLGFRRALSLAYLILSCGYFLLGSITAPWLEPLRKAIPSEILITLIIVVLAFGVSLVKPCVVGTTAHASKENVRSLGYSIYYTMVNIGGAAGPFVADWAHRHLGVENVFRVAGLSVFLMFFVVVLFFREPRKANDAPPPSISQVIKNFCVVLGNYRLVLPALLIALALGILSLSLHNFHVPWWIWAGLLIVALAGIGRFMWFLVLFTGYWIVFWQEFISLPVYIHSYINSKARVELILVTDGLAVICFTVLINYLFRKLPAFQCVILGTLISSLSWLVIAFHSTILGAVLSILVLALGEMIQAPRYYEYISRLAPLEQQGTYMGFAFLPIGIGSLIGGWFGGRVMHQFGEVVHQPQRAWWTICAVGLLTVVLLWIYDRIVKPSAQQPATQSQ